MNTITLRDLCIAYLINNKILTEENAPLLPLELYQEIRSISSLNRSRYMKDSIMKLIISDMRLGLYPLLEGGSLLGHVPLAELFMAKGVIIERYGYGTVNNRECPLTMDLRELFVVNSRLLTWNDGMRAAALDGQRDLVEFFISKGADDWNWGMSGATYGRQIALINFFISKGANDWNACSIS